MWIAIEKTTANEADVIRCSIYLITDNPDYEVVDIDNAWTGERRGDIKWVKNKEVFKFKATSIEIKRPPKNVTVKVKIEAVKK